MLDWKITETESLPDDEPPPPVAVPRLSRVILLLCTAIIVAVLITLWGVRGRLEQSETTIAADLLTLAKAEEQARRFNLRERVDFLLAADTDGRWRARYLALFDTVTTASPVEVTIEQVEFQGNGAIADVRVEAQLQRRYYELTPNGWRRAPMPMILWGDSLFTYTYPHNERIRVQYYRGDEIVAKAIMDDLSALIGTLNALQKTPLTDFSLTIRPEELRGVVLEQANHTMVVNSPQLATLPTHNRLTGEEAVRFAIARMLLSETETPRVDAKNLPAAPRFTNALRTILALRWALSPERYSDLRERWRAQLGDDWQSPFFANPLHNSAIDPSQPSRVQIAALLVVDAVYEQAGEAGVVAAFRGLADAPHWDGLLTPITNLSTLRLEELAQGATHPHATVPALPLIGAPVMSRNNRGAAPLLAVAGYPHAIELNITEPFTLQLPDGESLPAVCLNLFPQLTVAGNWREEGLRFTVTELTATSFDAAHYFTMTTAPATTEAVMGLWQRGQSGRIQSLAALQRDGTLSPLLIQAQQKRMVPITGVQGVAPNALFLTIPADSDCPVQALVHYRVDKGIVGQWLISATEQRTMPTLFWDEASQTGMLLGDEIAANGSRPYWRMTENRPRLYGIPDGRLPAGVPLALRSGGGEMVLALPATAESPAKVQLFALDDGTPGVSYTPPRWMSRATHALFSADGGSLFVTWNGPNRYNVNGEVSTIMRYDMATGVERPLWQPGNGNLSFYIVDSRAPVLYVAGGVARTGSAVQRVSDEGVERLYRPPTGYDLFYMVPCNAGGAMVVTMQRSLQQSIAYVPKVLSFLGANGNLRHIPIAVEDGLPLLCP